MGTSGPTYADSTAHLGMGVEPARQDHLGGGAVDHLLALAAREVGLEQRLLRLHRRELLVALVDREAGGAERVDEHAHALRPVALGAVGIDGEPDDDALRAEARAELAH